MSQATALEQYFLELINASRAKTCAVRDWLLRIWYCHHNARVLADMEYRFGCVLCHCTGTMSKPYYTLDAMYSEIDDRMQRWCDDAIAEYKKDYECHCDVEH